MAAPAKRGRGRPPVSDAGTARLHVLVPAEAKAELEREAARLETSAGELVREAIEAHLPRVRRRKGAPPAEG